MNIKKKTVFPGEELAVIEEYLPGKWTHEENGKIKASVFGTPITNEKRLIIKVLPQAKGAPLPERGDYVIAQIANTGRQLATVHVHYINGRKVTPTYTGMIHISQVTKAYIEGMSDAFKPGDVIRAKVVNARSIPIHLDTTEADCGVVLGLCSKCGAKLEKKAKNLLECPQCGNVEPRKVTIDYGLAGRELK